MQQLDQIFWPLYLVKIIVKVTDRVLTRLLASNMHLVMKSIKNSVKIMSQKVKKANQCL